MSILECHWGRCEAVLEVREWRGVSVAEDLNWDWGVEVGLK